MERIVIAGGTGFIGSALTGRLLSEGYEVVVLSRSPHNRVSPSGVSPQFVQWDARTIGPWVGSMEGASAIVNLAGESIGDARWTAKRRAKIVGSRVDASSAIVNGLSRLTRKPHVLVNGSAVGFYGETGDREITESAEKGEGFLADTVEKWELEAKRAEALGIRLVLIRAGVVLGKGGGALARMLLPFKLFMGGPLGSGRQWFPWIHIEDLVEVILFSIRNRNVQGVINAVSPSPETMSSFCASLGKTLHRPSWVRVPEFALRLGLGEMAGMILGSQRIIPSRLVREGFRFRYSSSEQALASLVK